LLSLFGNSHLLPQLALPSVGLAPLREELPPAVSARTSYFCYNRSLLKP
jgi:hypothetical protein